MAIRSNFNRFSRNLQGLNYAGFVSPQVAYTTDATFAEFVRNSVEGEIGIFLEAGTLKTTALAAGESFFIAQKKDGEISKTQIIEFDNVTSRTQTDYEAPQRQRVAVGYSPDATNGRLNIDLSTAGTQELVISVRTTNPANQPYPVDEGRAISTRTTDSIYVKLRELVDDLNNAFDFENNEDDPLIRAGIQANGAKTNLTNGATVTNGDTFVTSTAHGLSAGDYVALRDIVYQVESATTNNFRIDAPYVGDSETITAGANAAEITIVLASTEFGVLIEGFDVYPHFVVSVQDDLEAATINEIQAWRQGSGFGESVVQFENEAIYFAGIGSTANAQFRDDYGYPTTFASSSTNYDTFLVEYRGIQFPSAGLADTQTIQQGYVIIHAPEGGTTPTANLATVLGT